MHSQTSTVNSATPVIVKPSTQILRNLFRDPRDNLSSYLVAESRKPSSIITPSSETDIDRVINILWRLNIHAKNYTSKKNTPFTNNTSLIISKNPNYIDLLISNIEKGDHYSVGVLLGYPEKPSKNFSESLKDTNQRNYECILKKIVTQLSNRYPISVNFAYALHIPLITSSISGNIIFDYESEDLFNKYLIFVRNTNPELSQKIEKHMLNELNRTAATLNKKINVVQEDLIYSSD